jgi:beta-1,4-mannosyltransferase
MTSTVAFFPSLTDLQGNPYWLLLAKGLASQGVHVLPDNPRVLSLHWLRQQQRQVQVLHIHYFQDNYAYEGAQARLRWVLRFARNLVAARLLGYRVVWTVHNETPSFPLQPKWVEDLAHLTMARLASAVIVHCEYARELVARRYGRRRGVFVVPHPNFIGLYPGNPTRDEARTVLDLPSDVTVFLCFGQMRPNKGIEILLEAFAGLAGAALRLVIAGAPGPDAGYVERLRRRASQDPRVVFRAEQIPDDRVQTYFAASDMAVMVFARVLTSSSVILAMSLGKPVIAPREGCLPELIPPDGGWLYAPSAPEALQHALERALADNWAQAGQKARLAAQRLTIVEATQQTLCAYGLAKLSKGV